MEVDELTSPKPNIEESTISNMKDKLVAVEELSNAVEFNFVPELDDFLTENDGIVAEGEEVLIRCSQTVTTLNGGENFVACEPPTGSNDGDFPVDDIPTDDSKIKRKVEVEEEMAKNGEEEHLAELNVSQVAEEEHLGELNDSKVAEEAHVSEMAKDDDEGDVVAGEGIPATGAETQAETGEPIPADGTETEEETEVANVENDERENESLKVAESGEDDAMVEVGEDIGGESVAELDSEFIAAEDDDVADEKLADREMEAEEELLIESVKGNSGGKRKRGGKISKPSTRSPAPRKTIEEDVCFICFDGGDLVLCDRRNCPKAYHPSCVNRDEAFFQAKGRWNCVDWCL